MLSLVGANKAWQPTRLMILWGKPWANQNVCRVYWTNQESTFFWYRALTSRPLCNSHSCKLASPWGLSWVSARTDRQTDRVSETSWTFPPTSLGRLLLVYGCQVTRMLLRGENSSRAVFGRSKVDTTDPSAHFTTETLEDRKTDSQQAAMLLREDKQLKTNLCPLHHPTSVPSLLKVRFLLGRLSLRDTETRSQKVTGSCLITEGRRAPLEGRVLLTPRGSAQQRRSVWSTHWNKNTVKLQQEETLWLQEYSWLITGKPRFVILLDFFSDICK